MTKHSQSEPEEVNDDLLWGGGAIAAHLRRTRAQVYYLFGQGVFGDAVTKLGHRTLVGAKRGLANIVPRSQSNPSE
jgi:hypothetical protein